MCQRRSVAVLHQSITNVQLERLECNTGENTNTKINLKVDTVIAETPTTSSIIDRGFRSLPRAYGIALRCCYIAGFQFQFI